MNKLALSAAALAAVLLSAGSAAAQISRVSLEPRGGLAFPIDNEGLENGWTLGGDLIVDVSPVLGIYAGYNFNRFAVEGADDLPGDIDVNTDVHGFDAGVRATFAGNSISPFFKAGLLYQSVALDVDSGAGSFRRDSDRELGFEVGGGVELPLSARLSLTPGVTYAQVAEAEYVRADVGLRIRF